MNDKTISRTSKDDLQPLREVLRIIDTLNKLGGLGFEKHGWLDTAGDTLQAWIAAHGNKPTPYSKERSIASYLRSIAEDNGSAAPQTLMAAVHELERLQSMVDSQARMIAWLDPPDSPTDETVSAPAAERVPLRYGKPFTGTHRGISQGGFHCTDNDCSCHLYQYPRAELKANEQVDSVRVRVCDCNPVQAAECDEVENQTGTRPGYCRANDPLAQLEDDATFGEIVEEIQAQRGEKGKSEQS